MLKLIVVHDIWVLHAPTEPNDAQQIKWKSRENSLERYIFMFESTTSVVSANLNFNHGITTQQSKLINRFRFKVKIGGTHM